MSSNYTIVNGHLLNVDELAHAGHKYVRKEPDGKGGYRYYYKQPEVKGSRGNARLSGSKYGTYKDSTGDHTYIRKKSDKLLSSSHTLRSYGSMTVSPGESKSWETSTTTYEEGKLERTVNKGKAAVKRLFNKLKKKLKIK